MAQKSRILPALIAPFMMALVASACTPHVQVDAPDKPIEINLNVNIEHHIKVEMEKDIRQTIAKNPNLF